MRVGGRSVAMRSRDELKNKDTFLSALFSASTVTGQLVLLNGLVTGSAATERIGRKVFMKTLFIRFVGSRTTAPLVGDSPVRMVIVYDKQSNAVAPLATDILQNDRISGLTNLSNAERFRIVMDKEFSLGTTNNTAVAWKKYIKLNLPMTFNTGAAGTIADIQTGSMYVLSYQNGQFSNLPQIGCEFRIRYND